MLKLWIKLTRPPLLTALVVTALVTAALLIGRALPRPDLVAYVRANDGIYLLDVTRTRSQRLVADGDIDMQVTWSPDGERLAFVSRQHGNGEIYIVPVNRPRALLRLTKNSAEDTSPTWSPDGAWVAFVSSRDSAQEIYAADIATGRVRNLTQNRAADFRPAWSPDGGQLAFVSRRDDNYEVYILTSACLHHPATCTLEPRALLNLSANPRTDETPAWSPGGRWLAFVSLRHDNNEVFAVDTACVRAACAAGPINLTRHAGGDNAPVWSPHGDWLLFVSGRDRNTEIYAVKTLCLHHDQPCDWHAHNLTQHPAPDYSPTWSPDGARLAFVSGRDGGSNLYVTPTACLHSPVGCRAARRLTLDGGVFYPTWRP